jgi:sugar phosphate isomerase/epimerase
MRRRTFIRLTAAGTSTFLFQPLHAENNLQPINEIRLGGPLFTKYADPESWITALKAEQYTAAYCPVNPGASAEAIREYKSMAYRNHILIAEVGAWSNPISPDDTVSRAAMEKCITSLQLADEIGASCCVNISGSRNKTHWAGPHPDNLTESTFDLIVETTRKIIDAVKPLNTWYTLEAMPWSYPDSTDSYLRLIKAINRDRFAVHLDPVNFVTSPQVLYRNSDMIRDAFKRLGPWIKSCHAKDVTILENTDLPHLNEIRPGLGLLDYRTFLTELRKLDEIPLMLEHLKTAEEYTAAANYIRKIIIDGIQIN